MSPQTDRTRPEWHYTHPAHGTCVSTCPRFARCHCGCSKRPRLARVTFDRRAQRLGDPFVFAQGHHVRINHPRSAPFSRQGVDVTAVRPLVFWLRDRHGSMRAVAELLRIPEATIRGYAYKQELKRVPLGTASAIQKAVLDLRRGSPAWNEWE